MENLNEKREGAGLSANQLKFIAIIAMLIDHIAWAFVPIRSLPGQVMHTIGRLTIPIMCYFIAEGYHHTKNVKRYALRLGIFAIISHIPFIYFETGHLPISFTNGTQIKFQTSVMYNLFLGLISLIVINNKRICKYIKLIIIIIICIASMIGDWFFLAVLWILAFEINYGNFKKQITYFSFIAIVLLTAPLLNLFHIIGGVWWEQIFQLGVFLSLPLLSKYNGQKGSKNFKWVFYIFYPLHLLILGLIKYGF